ncbi:hypothetical protein GV792_17355 [Nocardia cyriacigeorgica]|uniref:Uncharacterized protein n=1 Tax=Nocardia cyriacigeorgica TaxID=135487 RepID=A0A6P1DDM8_9NOCA|nr:hypothetical protein [Nocardia cyriacigeorgica]NEW40209.1 hypothetical protein [Nocardia cyriacigeorgica]NEW47254.1 hypothetical protein [Nocardia cyriacigeorgica]NEW51810.1 hypothetical protein [Nocardia cyriacigeorgica]
MSESQSSQPWRQEAMVGGYSRRASVQADSPSSEGKVTCRIIVDGRVLAEHTAQATYATAFYAAATPEQQCPNDS